MAESTQWEDETYSRVFEEEVRGLERRRLNDPRLTIDTLRQMLRDLYIRDGNNWEGRGAVADIVSAATIAAYEYFIAEWQKESLS